MPPLSAVAVRRQFNKLPTVEEWSPPGKSEPKLTRPNLQVVKDFLDVHFFDGCLGGYDIRWCPRSHSVWGLTVPDRGKYIMISWRVIKLIKDDRVRFNMACGTLVHEMVHAWLNVRGHVGEAENIYHGELFWDKLREVKSAIDARGPRGWNILKTAPSALWIEKEYMTPKYWQCTRCGGVRGTTVRQALNKNPASMCHAGCKDKKGEELGEWEELKPAPSKRVVEGPDFLPWLENGHQLFPPKGRKKRRRYC